MIFTLTTEAQIDAAHTGPFGDRLHGHTYRVTAEWVFPDLPERDIRELAERLREVTDMLDHRCLDDVEGLLPSMEGIGSWILIRLAGARAITVSRTGMSARVER